MTLDKCAFRNIALLSSLVILLVQMNDVTPQIIDCAKIMMKVAKGIIKIYGRCSKDFLKAVGGDRAEYQRRVHCVMKCVMGGIGVLNEYDTVTNETMQVFFDKFIPEDLHEIGQIMVEGCIEEYAPLMNNEIEDDTCVPYGQFVQCVQNIVSEAC